MTPKLISWERPTSLRIYMSGHFRNHAQSLGLITPNHQQVWAIQSVRYGMVSFYDQSRQELM